MTLTSFNGFGYSTTITNIQNGKGILINQSSLDNFLEVSFGDINSTMPFTLIIKSNIKSIEIQFLAELAVNG